MPRIVIEKGPDKGCEALVPVKGSVLVGRDPSIALPLRDTMMSRFHFRIEGREDGFWLVDLDSRNGTLHNGKAIREIKLSFGDRIECGETLMSFLEDDVRSSSLIGQKIGGYRILERIGRGGMGTVYKAEQIDLQRLVALKVISPEHTRDKTFVDLFIHEARAAAKLNHPNIVQVYDVKRHNDLYYFSMEYVSGGSVQDVLTRQRRIPHADAVRMILEAARGLEYAHKKEIIHRDIKPENLMVNEAGSIKIGDLGLARSPHEKVGPDEEHVVFGTPHYIPPELVRGLLADYRADIYSLGATFYRMLTGVTPYVATSSRELIHKKIHEDPLSLTDHVADIPLPLNAVVSKMMARDPEKRYVTMSQVIHDIEKGTGRVEMDRASSSTGEPSSHWKKLLVAGAVAAALAIVAGTFVAAGVFRRSDENASHAPNVPTDLYGAARLAFENAKAMELQRMDGSDPNSIREAIDAYEGFLRDYSAAPHGVEAGNRKAALERHLHGILAARKLEEIEASDIKTYQQFVQNFQAGTYDPQGIESVSREYLAFAESPEGAETESGTEAKARSQHILAWKEEVERARIEFEGKLQKAQEHVDRREFQTAWELLNRFKEELLQRALDCPFAQDRYRSLLYDNEAHREGGLVLDRARTEYTPLLEETRRLEEKGLFDEALERLEPVFTTWRIEAVVSKAEERRRELENARAAWQLQRENEAREAHREALAADRKLFDDISIENHRRILAFNFKGAEEAWSGKSFKTSEYKKRIGQRRSFLARAANFKKQLIDAFTNALLKGEMTYAGKIGKIVKCTEKGFEIALAEGGTHYLDFSSLAPEEFEGLVKTCWKPVDPLTRLGLAIVSLELGLYDTVEADLTALLQVGDADIVTFAADLLAALKTLSFAESDEVEAEKRYSRVKRFLARENPSWLDLALADLELLATRYRETRLFAQRTSELDTLRKGILDKDDSDRRKRRQEERFRKIQDRRRAEADTTRDRRTDITTRISQISDPLERNLILGELYAAHADWRRSNEKLYLVIQSAEKQGAVRAINKWASQLISVYARILRNCAVQGNANGFSDVLKEAEARFRSSADGTVLEEWKKVVEEVQRWREQQLEKSGARIAARQKDFQDDPENPQILWDLARLYQENAENFIEARGCYRTLQEFFPDFSEVKSGECQYRLGGALVRFMELFEAIELLKELNNRYPDHPKVKEREAVDSVVGLLKQCYGWLQKMGYRREK